MQDGAYIKSIVTGTINLLNKYTYNAEWDFGSWEGFAISSKTDSVTNGFGNQYSVIAGKGADGSSKFALAYDTAVITLSYINSYQTVKSVMLTNSTYAYHEMKNGSNFSKKFTNGDWFKVVIKGFFNNNKTGEIEFYLADFRDGKSIIIRDWTKVSLAALGKVEKITFSFDSSDKGDFGINTPKYVCIDNLTVEVDRNCDCLKK